jgi:glycosyltransferase involved in cell wall biosynthesis
LGPKGIEVHGIEVAREDPVYRWDVTEGSQGFARHTLFPDANYGAVPRQEIAVAVRAALDGIYPTAVAINGWSVPEALAALRWCREHGRVAILMSESHAAGRLRWPWKEWVKGYRVRQFDAALVGGRWHRDYVIQLGMPSDRVFVGYDAVENADFGTPGQVVNPPVADRPYFFACSRFIKRKNLDGLITAYHRYRDEMGESAWNLVLSGDGAEMSRLKEKAATPSIRFPGFLQYRDLPGYYTGASAFIHPAKSEPWGLVINEAAASGLPLLVSRPTGAACELVRDGENGFLFDPLDPDDMTAAMVKMSRLSAQDRARMGNLSRELVANYGPERFGTGLWQAWNAAGGGRLGEI